MLRFATLIKIATGDGAFYGLPEAKPIPEGVRPLAYLSREARCLFAAHVRVVKAIYALEKAHDGVHPGVRLVHCADCPSAREELIGLIENHQQLQLMLRLEVIALIEANHERIPPAAMICADGEIVEDRSAAHGYMVISLRGPASDGPTESERPPGAPVLH